MVLTWNDNVKHDLQAYILHSRRNSKEKIYVYVNSLVDYVENLIQFPTLGKKLFIIKDLEIRQLIYKKHKIIYYQKFNKICILSVIYASKDFNSIFKEIKKVLK